MFDHDCRDADYRRDIYFHRPATTIVVQGPNGEEIKKIDLPELNLTREQVDPAWLAMREAERSDVDERGVK